MEQLKETLKIEFKSDVRCYPMSRLFEDLVGMANTEGGTLYLGIEDNGTVTGVNVQHKNIPQMVADIQNHTNPSLFTKMYLEEIDHKDVLVIEVPISHQLMMTTDGKYMRRRLKTDGMPETIPMKPAEILQRLSYIQALDPSAQIIKDIEADVALSKIEHERLRKMIELYRGDTALLELTDLEIDKALGFVKEIDGKYFPTIAGLLMVGNEKYIREFVPSHEVLFQVLDKTAVIVNPPAMHFSLLQTFEKVDMLFQSRISEREIMIGLFRVPIRNYEPEAFREGFVNALVHRDYFRMGAVQIQLTEQQMRIVSPGGFPEGVSVNNILTVAPTTRNILLVEAAKRIGLAERTGRGIDKIYASMLRSGHGIPDYSSSTDISVVLCLDSSEVDKEFVKILVSEQKRLNKELPVDVLIILSVLKQERRATLENLAIRIQKGTVEAKNTVEWLLEQGLVEGVGNGPARRYMLSSNIYAAINNSSGYTRQKGWDTIQEQEMIISYIDTYHKITRSDVIDLCRCNENHATWLLRKLVKENKIVLSGRGKYAYYQKKD